MELRSDYRKIEGLENSENISEIEFTESSENNQLHGGFINHQIYDDDSQMYGGFNKNELGENELYSIFQKAQRYREQMQSKLFQSSNNFQHGGADSAPKKGEVLKLMHSMVKNMKAYSESTKKFTNLKTKDFLKVCKLILDELKKQYNVEKINAQIHSEALKKSLNPESYIQKMQSSKATGGNRFYHNNPHRNFIF